jgi:hypothetical protein
VIVVRRWKPLVAQSDTLTRAAYDIRHWDQWELVRHLNHFFRELSTSSAMAQFILHRLIVCRFTIYALLEAVDIQHNEINLMSVYGLLNAYTP